MQNLIKLQKVSKLFRLTLKLVVLIMGLFFINQIEIINKLVLISSLETVIISSFIYNEFAKQHKNSNYKVILNHMKSVFGEEGQSPIKKYFNWLIFGAFFIIFVVLSDNFTTFFYILLGGIGTTISLLLINKKYNITLKD